MRDDYEQTVDRLIEREKKRNYKKTVTVINQRLKTKRDSELQERIRREAEKAEHEEYVRRNAEIEFEHYPITEVPDEVKLPTDYFDEVAHKVDYNEVYADHYMHRFEDTNREKYRSISERIRGCHKSWFGDHYKKSGVFNVKRVFHCHNKWCWLCTHLKQAKRLCKFHKLFEKLLKEYDLYHLVFTVKNVKGEVLEDTLDKMQKSLKKIIRYFQGFAKIADHDFIQYGFTGGLRSFEIVINPMDYHPHLHVLMTLKKGLEFPKTNINKFSFSNGSPVPLRKFSDFEIVLQKMFYLAFNGQRVNDKNIQALKIGYSCTMDFVEDNAWHEVFKYATKMSKDGASTCTYEQFCLVDDILSGMKMIQGYGIFNGVDKQADESDPLVEIMFEKVLVLLSKTELPERDVRFELDKLVDELHRNNMTVISKKMSYKYMQAVYDDLSKEFKKDEYGEDSCPF